MNLIHEIKEAVVRVGLNSKIEDKHELTQLMSLKSFHSWGDRIVVERLNDSDLLNYFKGLVVIEKELNVDGSTTPAVRSYREIEKRNLDHDYVLADWAFQYSDNEYIPFGFRRNGAQTAYEYIQWREDLFNRIKKPPLTEENLTNMYGMPLQPEGKPWGVYEYANTIPRILRSNSEETLQKLALVEKEVDAKVEEILKDKPRILGFCHLFWGTKKKLLKEEYGIYWLTPAECNPDVMYD